MAEKQNAEEKRKRGFAAMDAERQRQIASLGGRAAHEQGVAHEWDKQEAADAGKKGGQASGKKRNAQKDEREPLL